MSHRLDEGKRQFSRRACLTASAGISSLALAQSVTGQSSDESLPGPLLNRLVVSPNGPDDGGDFGPRTPGTRTSGLQEAFDAAKAQRRDLYLCGGSWTDGQNQPVMFFLHETLRVPWMQDFRMDSGHCVIQYTPKTGDAVHIDSQMSCSYRFGLIVSNSDGAVVRLAPRTQGPDRFKVITATDFHFNALVGGGGACPGGAPFDSQLDQRIRRIGTGLWLEGRPGSIDANSIHVTEIVGCERGLFIDAASTHNFIQATNIHLCHEHLVVGTPEDPQPRDNEIQAYLNSENIDSAVGARVAGRSNHLQLIIGRMGDDHDVVLESTAAENMISGLSLNHGITNRATEFSNRIHAPSLATVHRTGNTPDVPASGEWLANCFPWAVEVRIIDCGKVQQWAEQTDQNDAIEFDSPLVAGQSLILNPGDRIRLNYNHPPTWRWKPVG